MLPSRSWPSPEWIGSKSLTGVYAYLTGMGSSAEVSPSEFASTAMWTTRPYFLSHSVLTLMPHPVRIEVAQRAQEVGMCCRRRLVLCIFSHGLHRCVPWWTATCVFLDFESYTSSIAAILDCACRSGRVGGDNDAPSWEAVLPGLAPSRAKREAFIDLVLVHLVWTELNAWVSRIGIPG